VNPICRRCGINPRHADSDWCSACIELGHTLARWAARRNELRRKVEAMDPAPGVFFFGRRWL
jgi:hypothetical protein